MAKLQCDDVVVNLCRQYQLPNEVILNVAFSFSYHTEKYTVPPFLEPQRLRYVVWRTPAVAYIVQVRRLVYQLV